MKPTPAKPRSSIAHVEGSGTAVCIDSGFTTKLLIEVVAPPPKQSVQLTKKPKKDCASTVMEPLCEMLRFHQTVRF